MHNNYVIYKYSNIFFSKLQQNNFVPDLKVFSSDFQTKVSYIFN